MTPAQRMLREAVLAQRRLDFETIERSRKLEAPYMCATLAPGSHDIDREAIAACINAYPSALAEVGSLEWMTGLWQAIAYGYGGREGVGMSSALAFSLGQLVALRQVGAVDADALITIARLMHDVRNAELTKN